MRNTNPKSHIVAPLTIKSYNYIIGELMANVNKNNHIFRRIEEFFLPKGMPWYRKLWNSGSILTLKELLKLSHAVHNSVISESLFHDAIVFAIKRILCDEGIESSDKDRVKAVLGKNQKIKISYQSCDWYVLDELIKRIEAKYIANWITAIENGVQSTEKTARYLASHFMDIGYSSQYLYQKCIIFRKQENGSQNAILLLLGFFANKVSHNEKYEVMFTFTKTPRTIKRGQISKCSSMEWLVPKEVSQWLLSQKIDSSGVRPTGGLNIKVYATDKFAAIKKALSHSRSVTSRIALGTKKPPQMLNTVWVAGFSESFNLPEINREIHLKVLTKEGLFFSISDDESVENSIALVGFMNEAAPSPAITTGWAAIESLLVGPGGHSKLIASERIANIIACSFPRGELTKLAYQYLKEGNDDELTKNLVAEKYNKGKTVVIANYIKAGNDLEFEDLADQLAFQRVAKLINSPYQVLHQIREQVRETMHRLYRQRNRVVHGGLVESEYLEATLRTAAPLIGAGFDRIAQALYVQKKSALKLAAQAENRSEFLRVDDSIKDIIGLLD